MTSSRRYVVATSGHVDHGKSTLVRALTGIEPDRLAEERRRGLTIDLGFAWFRLDSGRTVSFVDVPGHERFLGNMLAGLGPAPVVLFTVAADQGWQAQSTDHLEAAAALGIRHGLVALTRTDLADDAATDAVEAEVRRRLAPTGLADAAIVRVSARTGAGLDDLRTALDAVLAAVPEPDDAAPVRLWIDRRFSIRGTGTVVTGTLAEGRIADGATLDRVGPGGPERVDVRGLQSHDEPVAEARGVERVALALRGVATDELERGDALVTPGAWWQTSLADARRVSGAGLDDVATELVAHVGTAAVPVRIRPFGADHARLQFDRPLPLHVGDRVVLRDPGARSVLGGVVLLDIDPPELRRRGDGARRGTALATMSPAGSPAVEVARRGALRGAHLRSMGIDPDAVAPDDGIVTHRGWLVGRAAVAAWARRLREAVAADAADPLSAGLSTGAAVDALRRTPRAARADAVPMLPDPELLGPVVAAARLETVGGRIRRPDAPRSLGAAEAGVAAIERRLAREPFRAPEADDLAAARLGARELAAAEAAGRLVRIADGVVLLPSAPAHAMRRLAALPQPFTLSQARVALDTTRRVAVPMLELLDRRGWTRRVDGDHREVQR